MRSVVGALVLPLMWGNAAWAGYVLDRAEGMVYAVPVRGGTPYFQETVSELPLALDHTESASSAGDTSSARGAIETTADERGLAFTLRGDAETTRASALAPDGGASLTAAFTLTEPTRYRWSLNVEAAVQPVGEPWTSSEQLGIRLTTLFNLVEPSTRSTFVQLVSGDQHAPFGDATQGAGILPPGSYTFHAAAGSWVERMPKGAQTSVELRGTLTFEPVPEPSAGLLALLGLGLLTTARAWSRALRRAAVLAALAVGAAQPAAAALILENQAGTVGYDASQRTHGGSFQETTREFPMDLDRETQVKLAMYETPSLARAAISATADENSMSFTLRSDVDTPNSYYMPPFAYMSYVVDITITEPTAYRWSIEFEATPDFAGDWSKADRSELNLFGLLSLNAWSDGVFQQSVVADPEDTFSGLWEGTGVFLPGRYNYNASAQLGLGLPQVAKAVQASLVMRGTLELHEIPEPATGWLACLGLGCEFMRRSRRRSRTSDVSSRPL